MPNPNYKKMFADLCAYHPKREDLDSLALIMTGQSRLPFTDTVNFPEMNNFLEVNAEAAIYKIPAGYTYLAQFISHDISFDEANDRHVKKDFPWEIIDQRSLGELRNLHQPNFNLESVYGHETPIDRNGLSRAQLMLPRSRSKSQLLKDLPLLKLGNTKDVPIPAGTASSVYPNDLPRGNTCVGAKIADPRNDENLLLAQTHVAFIKFHNAIVVKLSESENHEYEVLFEKARRLTVRHYQKIILTDFLPRIILKSVLEETVERIKPVKSPYRPDMFMPLEFSVAAFRFAHSMIRNNYDLNSKNTAPELEEMMMFTGRGEMAFGFHPGIRLKLPSNWIIDWNRFYEIDGSELNKAESIDTNLSTKLSNLMPSVVHKNGGRANLLAILDLYRGRRFGLPTGQCVARKLNVKSLTADEMNNLIRSKTITDLAAGEDSRPNEIKENLCRVFGEKTPLWFYVLAEAEIQAQTDPQNAGKLGEVGSRIIAETFIQLLVNSDHSILAEEWNDEDILPGSEAGNETFGMPEMLKFVQATTETHYRKLYPKKFYPQTRTKFDELNPLGKGYQ